MKKNYIVSSVYILNDNRLNTPLSNLPDSPDSRLRDNVTKEELRYAVLRSLAPDLPPHRQRYLSSEGFLDKI